MQVGDITEHANFLVFDKEAQKLIKVLGTQLFNMEEEDVDGDNIIPNSIKCIIGKTYIFQVKVTAYNFFICKQNFTETTKRTKNGNEVSKETICAEVKKRRFLKK